MIMVINKSVCMYVCMTSTIHHIFHTAKINYYGILVEYNVHNRSLILGRPDAKSSRLSSTSVYDSSPDLLKFTFVVPRPDVIESLALQQS